MMRASKCLATTASLLFVLAAGSPAVAQDQNLPEVEIVTTSIMVGLGGQKGDGVLRLPNLAKGCEIPFTVDGFGAGIKVGVSKVTAVGFVRNMNKLADLPGRYSVLEGESTLFVGGGGASYSNKNNKVLLDLKSRTEGLQLGVGAQGLRLDLKQPVTDAPRVYVIEFGFNKHWVSDQSKQELAQLINGWKCRFVSLEVVGHTDTVGKEDPNIELSDKRAKSVRDHLVASGFAANRISTRAAGKGEPLQPTGEGVRKRANRAVVVTVR
ncbi:MAG: OmpA family protein [Alphaproteobacteria bacterium]|nr:OmpA family protein [Alphaproteobacteria bacterium]